MQLKNDQRGLKVNFANGICVQILKDGKDFRGLGNVTLRRRKLRSAELPILPLVTTPDGYEVSRLELEDIDQSDDCLTLSLTPYLVRTGRMEWVSADGQDRWNIGPWAGKPERDRGGLLRIALRPVARTIGGVAFTGFSYDYKFRSRKYSIYRIQDRATWELGGRATGNSFWMQSPFSPPRADVQNKGGAFSTAWRSANAQVQQFLPLFTVLQGFTFQFDPQHLLVTAFEQPFHCRSLFEKEPGQNTIVHWHQLCDTLGGCLEFPPLQVLCAEGNATAAQRADQYCAVRHELQKQYRERMGILPAPTVLGGWMRCPQDAALRELRRGLDELARGGCERVYLPGLLRRRPTQPVRAVLERAAGIIRHAHRRGMEAAASLSECCACRLDEDGPAADGLLSAAMRQQEAWDRLIDHMRRIRRDLEVDALYSEPALEGVAEDLYWTANGAAGMGAGTEGHRIVSLHRRRFELTAALQRLGFKCALAGAGGLGGPLARPPEVCLPGDEFLLRDQLATFPYEQVEQAGRSPYEAYFRACAHRAAFAVVYDVERREEARSRWDERFATVNKAFHAVREYMERSSLLPHDHGILWSGPDPEVEVLWTFKDMRRPAPQGTQIFDVMNSRRVKLQDGAFTARAFRTYLLQRSAKS